jgi:hypothetical protein
LSRRVCDRPIGVLEAEQTEGCQTIRNDRFVAVVETPYNPAQYRSLEEVNPQRLDEIEHFFVSNKMDGGSSSRSPGTGPTAASDSSSKRPATPAS